MLLRPGNRPKGPAMSASELEMSSVRYPYRDRIFHVEKKLSLIHI